MTPFKAMYGHDPPVFFKLNDEPSGIEAVNEQIQSRNCIIVILKENLALAQEKMKKQVDKHRLDVQLEGDDLVSVKIRPYRLRSLAKRINEKLSPHFYGPFKVTKKVGKVAYKLDLPPTTCIHPVFYISQLKKISVFSTYGSHYSPSSFCRI